MCRDGRVIFGKIQTNTLSDGAERERLKLHIKKEESKEQFLRVGGPNNTTSRALMLSFCLSLWSSTFNWELRKDGSFAAILQI